MQSESGFNLHAGSFGNKRKREEEIKEELSGSRTKIKARRTRIEGRMGVEEERTRREAEEGRREST